MANFPGSAPAAVNVSISPGAGSSLAASPAPPTTVSEALAPPAPAADRPVLPQGVVDADAPAETTAAPALDANPYKTAAALQSHLSTMGVDQKSAEFGAGLIRDALSKPAPTPAQLQESHAATHAALVNEFGNDAPMVIEMAQDEVRRMSVDFPDLVPLLERTGLGNSLQIVRAFAVHAQQRQLAAKRAEFGLPAATR